MAPRPLHIGFVATRLEGTDGVSLEAFKWAAVLGEMGHACFYFAGASDRPSDRTQVVPTAHFLHPEIQRIHQALFGVRKRSTQTTEAIHAHWRTLEDALHTFVRTFHIDLLIVENALSLPMNVPLGLALTSFIAETDIPTIAHHHDFYWQRSRYRLHAAADYLQAAFPPVMPAIANVVINSYAAAELARRTGMRSTVIPNVMDFDHPPPPVDAYARRLRKTLDIADDRRFILQPTRVVPRKRIERSIELLARIDGPCTLVVTHASGDEGAEYQAYLEDFARRLEVDVRFASRYFDLHRGVNPDGAPIFSLADAYLHADLVTYPSILEGFGNAFIESVYFRRPIAMTAYEIFTVDIAPKGFEILPLGEFISAEQVRRVADVVHGAVDVGAMVDRNFRLGQKYYSYAALRRHLDGLIQRLMEGWD